MESSASMLETSTTRFAWLQRPTSNIFGQAKPYRRLLGGGLTIRSVEVCSGMFSYKERSVMEQPAKVREAIKRYPDESKVREIYRQMDDTEKAEAHRWIEA